jgi:acyl-CoA dehydrogenase
MAPFTLIILAFISFCLFAYFGRGWLAWVTAAAFICGAWFKTLNSPSDTFIYVAAGLATLAIICLIPAIRRVVITSWLMGIIRKTLPTISETEAIALNAGTTWWEEDLFSGNPDWNKLLQTKIKGLTKEEKAFLDKEVEAFCKLLNDEEIAQKRDLSPKAWEFIKKHKLFGMIIPKSEGGLGFSAAGHAAVVTKIATKSLTAAIITMVPNSLGPGELLVHYGTDRQKKKYLKNLAEGKDIPCFALTEPHAGSDAANGRSFGVIKKGKFNGKAITGIELTFKKRYITLAPIATVVGLAFRLYDPEGLIGDKPDLGITCALLPRNTKGLRIGNRHDPMGVPFPNGTVEGEKVFIPIDYVIGEEKGLGNGWRMLMEQLSCGRGISLPSLSIGGAQLSARAAGAYAQIREQFGLPIAKFEGVREPLARIAINAYTMNAAGKFTVAAVDAGERPAVASAIAKAYLTEGMRQSINDAMDIMGGAAICRGPRNIFSRAYSAIPIGITVEGANILTRTLIVFGQGAIRCHPFVRTETEALMANDLKTFDKALFGHINHVTKNGVRALWLALTGARLQWLPKQAGNGKYLRRLTRLTAAYAFTADLALMTLGGALKRKEYLSGRYADGLAALYMASCVLKHDADAGHPKAERALRDAALERACADVENALREIIANLPNRFAACKAAWLCFPLGYKHYNRDDALNDKVVKALMNDDIRLSLSHILPKSSPKEDGLGKLEDALDKVKKAAKARQKIDAARRAGHLKKGLMADMVKAAKAAKLITEADAKALLAADKAVDDVVQVDSFEPKVYKELR